MKPKLTWRKRDPGQTVADIPKEFGGGCAIIVRNSVGALKYRMHVSNNPHTPYFARHCYYGSVAGAKEALMTVLRDSLVNEFRNALGNAYWALRDCRETIERLIPIVLAVHPSKHMIDAIRVEAHQKLEALQTQIAELQRKIS